MVYDFILIKILSGNLIAQPDGLPNISGSISRVTFDYFDRSLVSGCFNAIADQGVATDGTSELERHCWISFDASASNSIYGRSNEVTTKNFTIHIWLRTA